MRQTLAVLLSILAVAAQEHRHATSVRLEQLGAASFQRTGPLSDREGKRNRRKNESGGAAAAFYTNEEKATYKTRKPPYSQGLDRLRDRFPDDDEASVFYALSLLGSPQANKKDFAYRKRAVPIP